MANGVFNVGRYFALLSVGVTRSIKRYIHDLASLRRRGGGWLAYPHPAPSDLTISATAYPVTCPFVDVLLVWMTLTHYHYYTGRAAVYRPRATRTLLLPLPPYPHLPRYLVPFDACLCLVYPTTVIADALYTTYPVEHRLPNGSDGLCTPVRLVVVPNPFALGWRPPLPQLPPPPCRRSVSILY